MPGSSIIQCDLVLFDLVLFDLVLFDLVLFDLVLFDLVLFDLVLLDALRALVYLLFIWHVYTQRRASGVSTEAAG